MLNFNKIVMMITLAIGMQTAIYASVSKYKKEIQTIVHFTHELRKEKNALAAKVAQWLEKEVLGKDYCLAQNFIELIDSIISGDCSMDEKISSLYKMKKDFQDIRNTKARERFMGIEIVCRFIWIIASLTHRCH